MNICLVSREYPSEDHIGGIGTLTEKTARALARLGQTVHVVTETKGIGSTKVEDGVTVHRLAVPRGRPEYVARARAVARAIHALPVVPDIVQVGEYRAEGFWYALHKHPRTKLVTHLCTPSFLTDQLQKHAQASDARSRLRRRLVDVVERSQTRRSDAIVSETNALADIVCRQWRIPRQRVATIAQGVDFAEHLAAHAAPLPEELVGREYIIYFGRLEERKGVHILARALPHVLASNPDLHVVLAGNDSSYLGRPMQAYVQECNDTYMDRLHFYPRLPQEQLYPLIVHALAAVLPSLWENLANTCLEALDIGKPVVATLGCGFGEVIEDGRSGLLVPPGDADALARAIESLLADRGRLADMALAAKARASVFSLDVKTQELLHFFEDSHQ